MLQSDLDLIRSCIDLAVRTSSTEEKNSHASKYDELPEDHILEQFSILCRKLQVQKDIKERCLIAVQNMILDTFSGLSWWEKTSRKHAAKYFSPDYCPGDNRRSLPLDEALISPAVSPLSEAMELSVLLNNRQDRMTSSTKTAKQELSAPSGPQLPLTLQPQPSREPKQSQSPPSWRPTTVVSASVPSSAAANSPSTLRDDIRNLIEHYRYASPSDTHDPIPTPMRSPVELISPIASSNTALTVRSFNDLSLMRSSLPFTTPPPPRPNRNLTFGESSVQTIPASASTAARFSQGSTNKSSTNQKVSAIKGINNSQYLHPSSSTQRANLTRHTSTPANSIPSKNVSHNSSISSIVSIGTNSSSTEVMTTMKLMLLFQRWIGKRSPNLSSTLMRMFSRTEETKSTPIILTELELWLQQKLRILLADKIKGDIFNLWAKLSGESSVAREHHIHKMKRLGLDGLIDMLLRKRFDRKTALSHLAGTRKSKDRKGRLAAPSSPVIVLGQGRVVTPALSYLTIFSRRYIKSKIRKMSKISRDAFARFQECVNLALTFRRFQRRITQWQSITALAIKATGKYNSRVPSYIVRPNSSFIAVGKALTYLSTYAKMKKRRRVLLASLRNRLQGNRFCHRVLCFFFQPVFLRCFNEWKEYLVQGGLTQQKKEQYDFHHTSARQQFAIGKWSKWTQRMISQRQRIFRGRPYHLYRSGDTPVFKASKSLSRSNNASRNALNIAANFVVLSRAMRRLFIFSKNTKYFSSSLEMRLHKMVRSGGLNDRLKYIQLSNASCVRILRFQDNNGSNIEMDNNGRRIIGLGQRYSKGTDHIVSDRSDLNSVVNNMKRYMVRDGGITRQEMLLMTPRAMIAFHRWVRFVRSKQLWLTVIDPETSQRLIIAIRGKCEYYPTILRNLRMENHEKELIGKLNEFLTIKSPIHGRQKRKQQDFEDWMSRYISDNYSRTLSSIIGDSIAEMKLCRHTLRNWLKKRNQRLVEINHIRSFHALLKMRAVVRWVQFSRNKLGKKGREVKKIRLRNFCLRWRGLSTYRTAKKSSLKKYFKVLKEKMRQQVCHRLWKRMYGRKVGFCFRRWVEVTNRREAAIAMRESRCRALVERWIASSAWASWMKLMKATALHRLSLLRLGWIRMSGFRNGFNSRSRSRSRGRLYVADEYKRLGSLARAMVRLSRGRLGQLTAMLIISRRTKNQMSNLTYLTDIGSKRIKRNIKRSYSHLFSADESSIDFIAPSKIREAKVGISLEYLTAKRKRRNTLTRYAFMQFVRNILESNQKRQILNYAREFAVRSALHSAFLKMRVRVKRRQKIKARLGQAVRFRTFRTWTAALTAFRAKCGLYHHEQMTPKKKLRMTTGRK